MSTLATRVYCSYRRYAWQLATPKYRTRIRTVPRYARPVPPQGCRSHGVDPWDLQPQLPIVQAAAAGHMCTCIVARSVLGLQLCLKFTSLVRGVGPRIKSFPTYVVLESSRVITVLLFMGGQRVCIPYLPARARPHMTAMCYPDRIDHFWRVLHCLWNVLVS